MQHDQQLQALREAHKASIAVQAKVRAAQGLKERLHPQIKMKITEDKASVCLYFSQKSAGKFVRMIPFTVFNGCRFKVRGPLLQ